MSNYGLQIRGSSGVFQFDGISLNMAISGIFTRHLKGGNEKWGPERWGYFRGWEHDFSIKSGTDIYAIASDQWIRVGVRIGDIFDRNKIYLYQDKSGGGGSLRVFMFKKSMVTTSDIFGISVYGTQSGTLGDVGLLKIINVFELNSDTEYWTYKAPAGTKIAIIIGGGRAQRRDDTVNHVHGVHFSHTYSRVIEEGTRAEVSFRESMREDFEGSRTKLNQSQRITLRIIIVDITQISGMSDF